MLNPDQTAQTYQDGRQQLPPSPAPPPERDSNSGLLKILLATVVGLVALMAVGTVVLLTSQSNVSTHINRSVSQNTSSSNATTTNKGTTQPQTIIGQPKTETQTTTVVQQPPPQTTTPVPTGLTACDQNISVNGQTSCGFADNVFNQYAIDVQGSGAGSYSVTATSPATGDTYTDSCSYANEQVSCSHGGDLITFPEWAAAVYHTH